MLDSARRRDYCDQWGAEGKLHNLTDAEDEKDAPSGRHAGSRGTTAKQHANGG
jgi:hypothetical protein